MTMNRKHNCRNPYQGDFKKVLCCCSAGLLRSPTAAWVLSNPPFDFNTRSIGLNTEYGLIQLDEVLLHWADEIVVMERVQKDYVEELIKDTPYKDIPVVCLDIPDNFAYRDPKLVKLVRNGYHRHLGEEDTGV